MFGNYSGRIKNIQRIIKEYFDISKDIIARSNLVIVKQVSIVAMAIVVLFIAITPIILPKWNPSPLHIMFIPVLMIIFIVSEFYSMRAKVSVRVSNLISIMFYCTLMGFAILLDVIPYPHGSAVFTPILLVIMPVAIIVPIPYMCIASALVSIIFAIMANTYKLESVKDSDLFCIIFALVISVVVEVVITKMRSQLQHKSNELKKLSMTDLLTGLYNKRNCEQRITNMLEFRNKNHLSVLMVMDIDDFKCINDTYGHLAGDESLEMVGNKLNEIFNINCINGRIGGDEFMVYMESISGIDECIAICEKLIETVGKSGAIVDGEDDRQIKISVSVGVAIIGNTQKSFEEIYKAADDLLYDVKQNGKNRFKITTITE